MGYQDFMYVAISIAVLLLGIFGSIALFYLIIILRDTSKVTEQVRETADKLNEYLLSPLRIVSALVEKFRPYFDSFVEKREEMVVKKKKGKK